MAYVHASSHPNKKLGPRGKKCILIYYSKHSTGYVFLGEKEGGSVTEIESRDVKFLEQEFPSKGEVCMDLKLYKLDESAPSRPVE